MKNSDTPTKSELHEAVVSVLAAMDLEQTVKDLRDEVANLGRVIDCQLQTLKAFSDLFLELTDKTADRHFLDRCILKAERQATRTRLPLWFWRKEEGLTPEQMLKRRTEYLLGEYGAGIDDAWDLLREFVDTMETPVSDEDLSRVIESVHVQPEGGNA
jgi:hypothetical protein